MHAIENNSLAGKITWLTGWGMLSTFGGRGANNKLSDPATIRVTVAETGCGPLPACKSEARLSSGKGPEVLQGESLGHNGRLQ